jgi:D-alanyl-D-alanine carboxypeptidase
MLKISKTIILIINSGVIVLLIAFVVFQQFQIRKDKEALNLAYAEIEERFNEESSISQERDNNLIQSIEVIKENLSLSQTENEQIANALEQALSEEKQKVASLQQTTEKIGSTVGSLEKLSQTDPELLYKYSKTFFLNEHYVPSSLAEIKNKYLYSERTTKYFHSDALPFLIEMLEDALKQNMTIYVQSAYRSFNEQDILKGAYTVTYGEEGANTFSADQGYSEHQLGTTVDFIVSGLGGELDDFGETEGYHWLLANAYKYGFILSYPENNEYYIFEPWHWRFVGKELAGRLRDEGLNFYDLSQRQIDEYLISIFDN